MDHAARCAFIIAQAAAMNAELEAMKVANIEREREGKAFAYNEAAFLALPDKYQLGWNSVISYLRE